MALTPDQLREYARMGAALRLVQLSDEVKTIHAAFPEFRSQKRAAAQFTVSVPSTQSSAPAENEPTTGRRRRRLTAAQKKFISERMKKYWAARKRNET